MKNYYLLPLLLISLFFLSCEDTMEDDQATLDDVAGQWLRVESNNDPADGIIINVLNGQAVITDAASANFDVNDILWINIIPNGPESFSLEVLGSDGNYYEASMVLVDSNEINLNITAAGAGNVQTWQRLSN